MDVEAGFHGDVAHLVGRAAGVLSDAEFQFRGVFDPVGHGVMVEWQWRSLPGASGQRQMPDGAAQARAHARTPGDGVIWRPDFSGRSEEHTSELQSLMRISYAVFCLKKKKTT